LRRRILRGKRTRTMAAKKRIPASEVYIGNLTVEASILSLAEQAKEDRAQAKEDRAQIKIILARMDQTEREIHTIAQAMMAMAQRMDARIGALEQAARTGG
jgi:hypothetical protein